MSWTLDATTPTLDAGTTTATLDGALAATFGWVPSYASSLSSEVKLHEARFGDGYSQRVGAGINNIEDKWELAFNNRSKTEKEGIVTFLRSKSSGKAFGWIPYDETIEVKVTCKKWSVQPIGPNAFSLSCQFERVYGE